MLDETKLRVREFGPIHDAEITINQINIICGVNSTGKSTLSKLLYSFLTGISIESDYIINKEIHSFFQNFIFVHGRNRINPVDTTIVKTDEQLQNIIDDWDFYETNSPYFKEKYNKLKQVSQQLNLLETTESKEQLKKIEKMIDFFDNPDIQYIQTIRRIILEEIVLSQTHNDKTVFELSNTQPSTNENNIKLTMVFEEKNKIKVNIKAKKGLLKFKNINKIFYIDSPSLIEFIQPNNLPYHYRQLIRDLKQKNKTFLSQEIQDIIEYYKEQSKNLIKGEFKFDESTGNLVYCHDGKVPMALSNTSSGFKQLAIIQLLLSNQQLIRNSLLIIDEPEVHIHQELQVEFAEFLIKLSKELDLILYINTHSPIFLEAIEVYSTKHNLKKQTNFYLAQPHDDNTYDFNKISLEDLKEVYDNLGNPYDKINQIRLENIRNNK